MMTALELLSDMPDCGCATGEGGCMQEFEWVAKRAREEVREAAALAAIDAGAEGFYDHTAAATTDRIVAAIRALPVQP